MKYLDWLDLTLFAAMLIVSTLIGVYFAYFAKQKQNTTSEYLMGGKTMGVFPISMSLIASYISGISILGLPSETYVFGTQYSMIMIPEVLVSIVTAVFFLPVFYKMQITSSYEYLGRRFSTSVKLLGSFLFCIKLILYISIVIYVPALAFSQVTGINLHLITPAISLICIFYTSVGGLKAVVWTDTFQIMIMMLGIFAVLIIGVLKLGGISTVIDRAAASDRLEFFNTDFDPRTRHTIWSVSVGNFFYWLATCSTNQANVQRLLSLPSLRKANIAVGILGAGIAVIVGLCCFTGLVIYAAYHDCDPLTTRRINKPDQLLPLYVMEVAEHIPGLPGIFLSGVFSAALSTMSTGLNSMTGVIYEDMIKTAYTKPISEAKASFIMKIIVVVIGTFCVGMVFVVEQLGTLTQLVKSLLGITSGALLGMFSLGMFLPWANHKGAFAGGIASLIAIAWISAGSQKEIAMGNIVFPKKPVSVASCPHLVNTTAVETNNQLNDLSTQPFILYQISYMWYTLIGTLITWIVGIVVSYWTGFTDPKDVDEDLITPIVSRFLQTKQHMKSKSWKIRYQSETRSNEDDCTIFS